MLGAAKMATSCTEKEKKRMIRFAMRLFRLLVNGARTFGSCHEFATWLQTPCSALKGRTPEDVVAVRGGLQVVEEMIQGIRHVARS